MKQVVDLRIILLTYPVRFGSNILACLFMICLGNLLSGLSVHLSCRLPGRVAQSVGHLNHKSGVLGSIPGLATYFRFSFLFFKKGSCKLLAKVCARSTG